MAAPELVASEWDKRGFPAETPPTEIVGEELRQPSLGFRREPERAFVYDGARAGRALRAGLSKRPASSRPLPMEDVYFYIKELDNTHLRRQADPGDKAIWTRLVGAGLLSLMMVILTYAPRPMLRHSGYRIEKLQQDHQALTSIQSQLTVRQEILSDLRRVATLAARQGLAQTPPGRFAWQNQTTPPVSTEGELAWNAMKVQP